MLGALWTCGERLLTWAIERLEDRGDTQGAENLRHVREQWRKRL